MDKLKVMVVDDESRMRKLVRDFLEKQDYEVIEAEDGEKAVDLSLRKRRRPDSSGRHDAEDGRMAGVP